MFWRRLWPFENTAAAAGIAEEGEAATAKPERVGSQVALAALDRRLELRGAVAAVPVALEHGLQVDEPIDAGGRLGGQRLPEAQVASFTAEVAGLEQGQLLALAVEDVGARVEAGDRVHDEVEIGARRPIAREAARRGAQDGRELGEPDRLAREGAGRAPPEGHRLAGLGRRHARCARDRRAAGPGGRRRP